MFEYELKTPWDITTARAIGYKSLRPHVVRGHDIDFAPDGTRLYVDDRGLGKVVQFDLQPAWNIESATFSGALNMVKLQKAMRGIQFSPSGKRLFVLDTWLKQIFEFEVETPWDVKSAKLRDTLQLDKKIRDPRNLVWRPDGRVVYITDTFSGTVRTLVVP
jgi:sugar lactone lactonase YvrE